eukprot:Seg1729.7 transcript_id=Seg1729.7/GoldUCD/mRNA.D3Y31 product="putative cytosolic oligopeptidase A" protein_id=Seg1729.7/GoldUCD/D3Y31
MRFRKMLGQSSVGNCSIFRGCFSVKCLQLSMLLLQLRFVKRGLCLSRYSRQASDATRATVNPLLGTFNALNFQVSAQHVEEAIPQLVKQTDEKFKEFEQILDRRFKNKEPLSWQTVVQPIEDITDRIKISWGVVSHLHNVKNSDGFREAYSKVLPEVITLLTRISQSKPVYEAFKTLSNGSHDLDEAQQRIIASAIKSAYHSGVSLEGQQKERFNAIVQELAALSTTFSNNVLDSVKAFGIMIEDPKDVEGLPETLLQLIAKAAASQLNKTADAEKGPWKLTLDTPCFEPFMKHSTNRPMRERLFKAMITRASSGTHDNREVITSIRKLRQETAEILGFPNYAHVSLDTKMAANPKEVMDMIENLKNKSKPIAQKEISTLIDFAAKAGFKDPVSLWDFSYFGERQRETLFSLKEEEIRVYFPLPRVLDGLFKLSSELFGIDIKSADGEADVWDQTIRYFKVFDKNGDFIASFYLDPYSRPNEKRGGAWMDSAISRSDHLNRKPIAYLVCNQSPPNGDKPALMTFGEVNTLFHEFGHGLQHMLTQVKYPEAAGTANIEWDAVEVPSQFMESWLYDWPTIQSVSGHYKTGETLPREFFDRLLKARTYMAGSGMLRQLYFAALDLELHTSNESWPIVMKRIADDYTVVKPLPEDMFPCSFTHIFAGGYAAGYYSYKWAEVMAADAFSAFEDVGLQNRKEVSEVGKRFRKTFLALGGGRDPKKVFIDFRGRDYKTDALLHQYGMK